MATLNMSVWEAAKFTDREKSSFTAGVNRKLETLWNKLKRERDQELNRLSSQKNDSTELKNKLTEAECALKSMESQLNTSNAHNNEMKTCVNKLEIDNETLRKQKNDLITECSNLKERLEQQSGELESIKTDIKKLSNEYKNIINQNSILSARNDEIENKAQSVEQREKRLEQERALLNNQIETLTDDIDRYKRELRSIQDEEKVKFVDFESKLVNREEELKIANQKIKHLLKSNENLTMEKNNLSNKVLEQSEMESGILDNYKDEIKAKTKLNEMYTDMLKESEDKCKVLEEKIKMTQTVTNDLTEKNRKLEDEFVTLKNLYDTTKQQNEEQIASLNSELEKAHTRLQATKEESVSLMLEDLTPSASATCNLIKTMSLTQVYGQLIKLSNELNDIKNEKLHLQQNINILTENIDERNQKIEDLSEKCNSLTDNNLTINKHLEESKETISKLENEKSDLTDCCNQLKHDNNKIQNEISDLCRQVCYLLQQIQSQDENSEDGGMITEDVSKKLVTFKDIEELQANNLSLLRIVNELNQSREISNEKMMRDDADSIVNIYKEDINNLKQDRDHNLRIINALTLQKDKYEKLYQELIMKKTVDDEKVQTETESSDKSVLDEKIADLTSKLEKQAADHTKYKDEKLLNEQILNDQLKNVQNQLNELSSKYAKALSETQTKGETLKNFKLNIDTYKKQIESLEDRNKIYESSIVKQEETIKYLRDELMETLSKLTKSEISLDSAKQECKFLKDSENRLKKERDTLRNERYSHSLLINEIELLKASRQRLDGEEKFNYEMKLNTLVKERDELQHKLKQQIEQFNEMKQNLERKYSQTQTLLTESNDLVENKKAQIISLNTQLESKNKVIDDLNKRILGLVNVSSQDEDVHGLNKIKELEDQLLLKQSQIDSLQQQLFDTKDKNKEDLDKHTKLNEQFLALNNAYSNYKETAEIKLKENQEKNNLLEKKINELNKSLSNQSLEIDLLDGPDIKNILHVAQDNVEAQAELVKTLTASQRKAKLEIEKLHLAIQAAEEKYAEEMMLHSSDIQANIKLKQQLTDFKAEINNLKSEKSKFQNDIDDVKNKFNAMIKQLKEESEEAQSQLNQSKQQNCMLQEQLQILSKQTSKGDVDLDKSCGNLLQIVNQFNKEKEMFETKYNAVLVEKNRMRMELELTEKKIKDLIATLNEKNNVSSIVAPVQNTELLNKMDTFNALTDCNVVLRKEKERLMKKVFELDEQHKALTQKLNDLQKVNSEINLKAEALQNENNTLKGEVNRWRARVNEMADKINKQSPEDWKRLQNERKRLAEMLTEEKKNSKISTDELDKIKIERTQLQENLKNVNTQLNLINENFNKQSSEINAIKDNASKVSAELLTTKTSLDECKESNTQLNEALNKKKEEIEELTKRESNVRRIAIKYKTEYQELCKNIEGKKSDNSNDKEDSQSETDKQIQIYKEQIATYQEKNDNLEKEIEILRENQDEFEKIKKELNEAQISVAQLSEANTNLNKQIESKIDANVLDQSKEEFEFKLRNLKTQYEDQIASLNREKIEMLECKDSEIIKINRKVEILMEKIKTINIHRGLDISPSSMRQPSTSSVQNIVAGVSEIHKKSTEATSEISSSPSSSQSVTENFPTSSSTGLRQSSQFCNVASLPPESTQDADSESIGESKSEASESVIPQSETIDHENQSVPMTGESSQLHQMASSSSNNINNSNSTVTTSHSNDESENGQRVQKRTRQTADQTDNLGGKRIKIQRAVESELEYQVPTSSQREEDDCAIVVDSGDDENQCGNSCQETIEEIEDDEGKVVQSAQSPENQSSEVKEESVASGSTSENNEVEVIDVNSSPEVAQAEVHAEEMRVEENTRVLRSSTQRQSEMISSATERSGEHSRYLSLNMSGVGSGNVGVVYDEGNDSIVPSTPILYMPRKNDGFGEAVSSPARVDACFTFGESSRATSGMLEDTHPDLASQIAPHIPALPDDSVDNQNTSEIADDPSVSSQSSLPTSPTQHIEEGSEAEASSTLAHASHQSSQHYRGKRRRGRYKRNTYRR